MIARCLAAAGLLVVLFVFPAAAQDAKYQASSTGEVSPSASITRSTFAPVPLKAPQRHESAALDDEHSSDQKRVDASGPLLTVASSLAIVLGLFAALVWVTRKASKSKHGNRNLPDDALKLLGSKAVAPGQSVVMLRCGRSILVCAMNASGMQRLSEITDDDEVRHLEALCLGNGRATFQETLREIEREPIKRGFTGEDVQPVRGAGKTLFRMT